MKKVNWTNLTHQLWKENQRWSQFAIKPHFIILCSGGLDSMVLLDVLREIVPKWGGTLSVLHCHHGGASRYRKQAQELVTNYCLTHHISLELRHSVSKLSSEAEMRRFRREEALKLSRLKDAVLVTAHHKNDLLETRVLRLIRGVGPQGIRAIQGWSFPWWRPFLNFSKVELIKEARHRQLNWLEDPSNQETQYLRNWVRHEWLPQLESRKPGSSMSLERSLENILGCYQSSTLQKKWQKGHKTWRLPITQWLFFTSQQQNQLLAEAFLKLKHQDYTVGQINEVKRRLLHLVPPNSFIVGGVEWKIKNTWLYARKSNLG